MRHVVHVESASNPFAVGVVGGRLSRQPRNLHEALEAVRLLKEQGYNFSVGIAQVNRYNLAPYGLKSYAEAFEVCPNLRAGSRILQECYRRSHDWGKAFSCYYAGDFVTGFQHGYVQKVFDSIGQQGGASATSSISIISRRTAARRLPARDDGVVLTRPDHQATGQAERPGTESTVPQSAGRPPVSPAASRLAGIPVEVIGAEGTPGRIRLRPSDPATSAVAPVRGGALVESAGTTSTGTSSASQADGLTAPASDSSFVF